MTDTELQAEVGSLIEVMIAGGDIEDTNQLAIAWTEVLGEVIRVARQHATLPPAEVLIYAMGNLGIEVE